MCVVHTKLSMEYVLALVKGLEGRPYITRGTYQSQTCDIID